MRTLRHVPRRGFTLIEMMVVVAMLAIITAIGAPGLRQFLDGQRVKSAAFDLTTDLLLARSEALKRNAIVTVTPVGGDWRAGWTAASGGVELINRSAPGNALAFVDAPASIRFNPFGRVDAPAAAVRLTLGASDSANPAKRCIELDLSGRASSRLGACA